METDARGVFLRVNKPFCAWVGYGKADLVGKKRLQELLTMGARIFHQTHWAPLLEMQGSISELKLDVRHRDGSSVPMVLNVVRHGHGPGHTQEVAAFVAHDRDKYEQELLSARKRLETHVAEVERLQAETKDRALFAEQMIGIVSHDLRNPLSAVHTGIQVLSRTTPSDNQTRVLSRMAQSVDRANRLVSDLLDFTAARVGKALRSTPAGSIFMSSWRRAWPNSVWRFHNEHCAMRPWATASAARTLIDWPNSSAISLRTP